MKVIALGATMRGDDGFALALAQQVFASDARIELILAGRPGPGLVDLLDTHAPVLLLDVVVSGHTPGSLHHFALAELPDHARALAQLSSHGFGPAEALELAKALGRTLPRGEFIGIEGARFDLGQEFSPDLLAARARFEALIRARADTLLDAEPQEQPCTSPV